MIARACRLALLLVLTLAILASCSSRPAPAPNPTPPPTPVDYSELAAAIEDQLTTGSAALDSVRAVLVSVDGETKLSHYRHGFTAEDSTHVWSVTKSVTATLLGIAISDGILDGLDQTLGELLPEHRSSMSPAVAAVTLRQLMTMSGGFGTDPYPTMRRIFESRGDLVAFFLKEGQEAPAGTQFLYSNVSSHLVVAVLASALRRAEGDHPRSVLDYARARLFEPLQIDTDPAWAKPLIDVRAADFAEAGFGWGTDPKGIPVGALGLRLTAPDLVKLGELYLNGGTWGGKRIFHPDWVEQVTTPSGIEPQYGLMWWLNTWRGQQVYAARGSGGQMIVVVPDRQAVIAIVSAITSEYAMTSEALLPLLNEVIIPRLR